MALFDFFSDPQKKLNKQYQRLLKEAFDLSKTNRTLSDQKYAEAEKIAQQIDQLKKP